MHLLLDSDSLCYQAGFSANEPGQEALACHQVDDIVTRIIGEVGPETFRLYLTGSDNFRYKFYPAYKDNRKDLKRPIHLQTMREYLVSHWDAIVSDGVEADDCLGIAQCAASPDTTCIGAIDKDLLMIPGSHYNYNKKTWLQQTPEAAMKHFYYQLIMGDRADNIPGFDGKMRNSVPQFLAPRVEYLDECSTEEMLSHVMEMWGALDDEERLLDFNKAAHCLWIQRKERDDWRNYLDNNLMEELGLPVDLIRSLPAPFEQQVDDGLQNSNA